MDFPYLPRISRHKGPSIYSLCPRLTSTGRLGGGGRGGEGKAVDVYG